MGHVNTDKITVHCLQTTFHSPRTETGTLRGAGQSVAAGALAQGVAHSGGMSMSAPGKAASHMRGSARSAA